MTKQSTIKLAKLQKIELDKVTDGYYKTLSELSLLFCWIARQNKVTYPVASVTHECTQLY